MTLAIDAILIFAAALCIWAGARRGFVKSVMGLVSTLVSFFAAYAFSPSLAGWIGERFFRESITAGVRDKLHSLAFDTATDLFNFDRLLADKPDSFLQMLKRCHIDLSGIEQFMKGVTQAGENGLDDLAERISDPAVSALSHVIAFAVIFIGVSIVMIILTLLIDLIFRLPVLRSANIFLGVLVGIVEAVVLTSMLALILNGLVRYLGVFDATLFGDEVVDNTMLCSFLVDHSIFSFLNGIGAKDTLIGSFFAKS